MARPKPLTPKQEKFVSAVMEGHSNKAAAEIAGTNKRIERANDVKAALAAARANLSEASTLTRLDVLEGILDAIQLARTAAEPATMIQGYDKLAKIMGFYAPEQVKVEVTISQDRLRSKMEAMTDEELLQLAEGHTVEGEFSACH